MNKLYSLIIYLFISLNLYAQNEFYINGDNSNTTSDVYVDGADGTNPTLYVAGEIINNQGDFENASGEIELTGNFTNTADGTNASYRSTGIERFSGNTTSRVMGDLDGTTGTINQFHDLKVNKANV